MALATTDEAIALVLEKARAIVVLHDEFLETQDDAALDVLVRWSDAVEELREALSRI